MCVGAAAGAAMDGTQGLMYGRHTVSPDLILPSVLNCVRGYPLPTTWVWRSKDSLKCWFSPLPCVVISLAVLCCVSTLHCHKSAGIRDMWHLVWLFTWGSGIQAHTSGLYIKPALLSPSP